MNANTSARQPQVPFADFNPWFLELVKKTKPKIVVAIARGAVRLLQLQMVRPMLPDVLITSECALPFFPDSMLKGQRVLVFDDSLIFGSTMWDVRQYLRKRGAKVSCAAYIIDRETFYAESRYPTDQKRHASIHSGRLRCHTRHKLWQTPVRQHHSNLVASILRTSGHYNLDFPSFSIKLAPFTVRDVHEILRRLSSVASVSEIRDVSSPLSANFGVYRVSILLKPDSIPNLGLDGVAVRDYSKVRVTINVGAGEVRVTPIPQLAMREGLKFENVVCPDETFTAMWQTLIAPRRYDENYSRSLFRLLTSFVGILIGTVITEQVCAALAEPFRIQEVGLLAHDVESVLGKGNQEALTRIHAKCRGSDILRAAKTRADENNPIIEPCDEKLLESVAKRWSSEPKLAPHQDEFATEALAKVFLTIRAVTDNPERRKKIPHARRLQVGLPYKGIYDLLVNRRSMQISPTDLAFALDVSIDHGQAVPKILRVNNTWVRAFYAGEGVDGEQLKQFALHVNKVYREFREEKNSRPLTGYDINKLGASLKSILPWLPISTKSFTFGKICTVGKDELPDWLSKGDKPLTATAKGDYEANPAYVFQPNLNFSTAVRPTWTPQQKRDFHDAFLYTATAFQRMDRTIANDAKLLLSTCRTQLDTYDAFACEAHSWASHSNHWHFGTLVSEINIFPKALTDRPQLSEANETIPAISRLSPGFSGEITKQGVDALVWCCIYINEAFKKREIFFKRFEQLTSALRKAFYVQGREAKNYWDYFVEEPAIIDSSRDKELDQAFDTLAKLVSMEARLTSYVVLLLLRGGVLNIEILTKALEARGVDLDSWLLKERRLPVLAGQYNAHFGYLRSRGLTSLVTRISEEPPEFNDLSIIQGVLSTVRKSYSELRAAIEKECPEKPNLLEGEYFRYAWRFERSPRPELFQPALFQI